MYADVLLFLRCPACDAEAPELLGALEDDGEIVAGALRCPTCRRQTAIIDGIWDTQPPLMLTPAQLINYFPPTARLYEPAWRWYALTLLAGRRFPLREELTLLRGLLQPCAGQLYVDVACSAGMYARALAATGAVVAGVDHAWAMVREARRRARSQGSRISYIRASAQALPFAGGAAAGAAMGGSLNEIGDQLGALREIRRIMHDEGRFFCMNLLAAKSFGGHILQHVAGSGGIDFPSLETLNDWFRQTGWRRLAQWRWGVVAITLTTPLPGT